MSDYTDEELAQACEDFERTNGHRPGTTAVRERARALRAERERDGEREAAVSLALQLNVAQTECAELREIVEDLRKPSPMWQRIDELAQRTLKATGHDITADVMAERDDLRRRLDATVAALREIKAWHVSIYGPSWSLIDEAITAAQPQADAPSVTQAELQAAVDANRKPDDVAAWASKLAADITKDATIADRETHQADAPPYRCQLHSAAGCPLCSMDGPDAPPLSVAEMDEAERRSAVCRHGTEGAWADPRVCSACIGESCPHSDAPQRDESKPPPGWIEYIPDHRGVMTYVYEGWSGETLAQAWRIYDAEHGYAPTPAEPVDAALARKGGA